MNIRYLSSYPLFMDQGGGSVFLRQVNEVFRTNGHSVELLDFSRPEIDFEVLFVYGFTFQNPELLAYCFEKGVKVVLFPIFDRIKPLWQMQALKPLQKAPFLNLYNLRSQLLNNSNIIVAANLAEKREIISLFNAPEDRISIIHHTLRDEFIEMAGKIGPELFFEKYGIRDFIFCPAATICKRKNQLSLLAALKNTNYKIVLNNTHKIEAGLEQAFTDLAQNNPNLLLLEGLSQEMMISCYKNAKISVSLSNSETAGYVNLEAGYCGSNLVVSSLPAFIEYLEDKAVFVDQNNLESVKTGIEKALTINSNPEVFQNFVRKNYTLEKFYIRLLALL